MKNNTLTNLPYLLNRKQASDFLGIDATSFDKYIRPSDELLRFMVGKQERYTVESLEQFIKINSI